MPIQRKGTQWSKLKSRVKEFICPELRKRIDIHVTSYRRSHGVAEKAWITVDGERVATYSWYQSQWKMASKGRAGEFFDRTTETHIRPRATMTRAEVWLPQEVGNVLSEYPQVTIQAALRSPNPLVRALAIVDRRTSRGTLAKISMAPDEDPLVRAFFGLRRDVFSNRAGTGEIQFIKFLAKQE
jgi:hypothetical protein